MSTVTTEPADSRRRRRLAAELKQSMRDMRNQLSVYNRQVGARLELKDVDVDCLDLVNRHSPLSPSALARLAGLHPATMTGILDRLERGGWVARDRLASDRRAVVIRSLPDRTAEMYRVLSGMNTAMDRILDSYTEDELKLLADFLRRTTDAGQNATNDLVEGHLLAKAKR